MSIHPSWSWWYRWSWRKRPGALRLPPRTTASWWRVIRVMVWGLPPERAGRAPHASRHSNRAEVSLGAGEGKDVGPGNWLVVRLAPVADVAAGFGLESCLGPVADAETESIRVLLAQALTMAATPTPPASRSS